MKKKFQHKNQLSSFIEAKQGRDLFGFIKNSSWDIINKYDTVVKSVTFNEHYYSYEGVHIGNSYNGKFQSGGLLFYVNRNGDFQCSDILSGQVFRTKRKVFICPIKSEVKSNVIRIFVQRYTSKSEDRQRQLQMCLDQNRKLKKIGVDIVQIYRQERISFRQFFEIANQYVENQSDITVIANSDIVFYQDFIQKVGYMSEKDSYCLSRYQKANVLEGYIDKSMCIMQWNPSSFDSWIFRGKIKQIKDCDFGLGVWGCDGSIAKRIQDAGYRVFNPAMSLKSYHIHQSNFRTNQYPQAPFPRLKVGQCHIPWSK